MRRFSLRARLIVLLVTSLVIVWSIALVVSYIDARHELDELLDARLEATARALIGLNLTQLSATLSPLDSTTRGEDGNDDDPPGAIRQLEFQVWSAAGGLLLRSKQAPRAPFNKQTGYLRMNVHDQEWQSFALWNSGSRFQVRIFDDEEKRRELTGDIVARVSLPLALSLPVLMLVVWLAIGRGLAPLAALSSAVSSRHANNLEPIALERVPREVEPLVASLNELLARLAHSLQTERRFTADAAHELRTPLAAIRAQAQIALGSEDKHERQHALERIIEGVDRSTRLASQLLTLARMDRPHGLTGSIATLDGVVKQCAGRFAEAALRKNQDLSVTSAGHCRVEGEENLLDALCSNLIDNAITYTQAGGRIEISVHTLADAVELVVRDNGPGVSSAHRVRLLDRFYRVAGNDASGSGLGLSIVDQIARLHGAALSLQEGLEGKGLGVCVRFPAAKSGNRSL